MMKLEDIAIGDKVKIDLAPDVEAQVTAICVRQGGFATFEVTWMIGGEVKTAWLTTDSLSISDDKKKLGFR